MTELDGAAAEVRETADELGRLLPALRRAVVRGTRAREGLPTLSEAQVALLRALTGSGPRTPAELARSLHLARPTVSNLLRELVGAGLLDRRPSPVDGRSVVVDLTPRGREVLEGFRAGSERVLADAVGRLPASHRDLLHQALPALALLLDELDTSGGAPPGRCR